MNRLPFNTSTWRWIAIGLLVLIAAAAYLYWHGHNHPNRLSERHEEPAPLARPLMVPPLPTTQANRANIQASHPAVHAQAEVTTPPQMPSVVSAELIQQPIATDAALIKDELAQLADISAQLEQQKQLLQQQHHDADLLIQLKQQQLADLEAQLAAPSDHTPPHS